jgi:hypothetical protein
MLFVSGKMWCEGSQVLTHYVRGSGLGLIRDCRTCAGSAPPPMGRMQHRAATAQRPRVKRRHTNPGSLQAGSNIPYGLWEPAWRPAAAIGRAVGRNVGAAAAFSTRSSRAPTARGRAAA